MEKNFNMTAKEKAKELFGKYATYVVMWAGDVNTSHQNCKQCALIAVDEMIEVAYWQGVKDYLKEVKKEIENL
jgi:hypothetical protein